MNRIVSLKRKTIALVAALLAMGTLLASCKKEVKQENEVTTEFVTEASVGTTPEETTVPEETEIIETIPKVEALEAGSITYAEYLELSTEEQQAYYENFETADAFFAWLDVAKAEYEAIEEDLSTGEESDEHGETGETESVFFVEEGMEDLE